MKVATEKRIVGGGAMWRRIKYRLKSIFIFCFLASILVASAPKFSMGGGADVAIYDIFLVSSLLFIFVYLLSGGVIRFDSSVSIAPLILYYVLISILPILGFFVYGFGVEGVVSSIRMLLVFSSCFSFWFLFIRGNSSCLSLLRGAMLLGVVANLALGVLQQAEFFGVINGQWLPHYRYEHLVDNPKFDHFGRAVGFFSGPNQLGWFGLVASMFFMGTRIARGGLTNNLAFVLSVGVIVVSTSRSALVSFLLGYFVVLLLLARISVKLFFKDFIIGSLCVLGVAWYVYDSGIGEYIASGLSAIVYMDIYSDASLGARLTHSWVSALEGFKEYPFGYFGDPVDLVGTIDSGWLSYLLQGGMILVGVFALLLATGVYRGSWVLRRASNPDKRIFAVMCVGVSSAISVGSFVLSPMHYLHVMIVYLVVFIDISEVINHK